MKPLVAQTIIVVAVLATISVGCWASESAWPLLVLVILPSKLARS